MHPLSSLISDRTVSLAVFGFSYLLIAAPRLFFKLNRAAAALLGAVLMVALTDLGLEQAFSSVNWDTITLLLGMMIIIAFLRIARFFDLAATRLVRLARDPRALVFLLVFASGGLSALFVNDTVCLLVTPIVLEVALRSRLPPVPFLMAVATGSNVGSVVTLTGNPQNMIVGTELVRRHPEWSYGRFTLYMLPVGAISLAIAGVVLCAVYRRELAGGVVAQAGVAEPRVNRRLIAKSVIVLLFVLAGFLAFPRALPLVALAGGTALLCWARRDPERALRRVDWSLLLFFAALFVIIGGVNRSGVIEAIHRHVAPLLAGSPAREVGLFSVVSVGLSQLLSNVPYVLVAGGWVEAFARPDLGWLVLAMASTFAGNLTIFGSVANMIVVEIARDRAPISFAEYCRAGIPITLLTTAAGVLIFLLYARFL